MGNWSKLSVKNKLSLSRAEGKETKEVDRSLKYLEELIERYNLVDYTAFSEVHPISYVLKEGNIRAHFGNPANRKSFFIKYSFNNPEKLDYPLIDHAEYFRNAEKKAFLVSHTYQNQAEIEQAVEAIRKENGYENIEYDILENSYYSDKARCVVFYY